MEATNRATGSLGSLPMLLKGSGYVNHSGDLAQKLKNQTYFEPVSSDDESTDEGSVSTGGYVDVCTSSDDLTADQSSKDDLSLTPTASSSSIATNSYAENLSSVSLPPPSRSLTASPSPFSQPADQSSDEGIDTFYF